MAIENNPTETRIQHSKRQWKPLERRSHDILNLVQAAVTLMGEPTVTPVETGLSGTHMVFSLAWSEQVDSSLENGARMLVPATTEEGLPVLVVSEVDGEGMVSRSVWRWPDADEDHVTALFNLIVGFTF